MHALTAVARRKRLVVLLPLAACMAALTVGLVSTPIFKSTTKLLPPQQAQSSTAAILAQLGGVAGAVGGSGKASANDVYVAMLSSRTIADKLISRFNLRSVYGNETPERTRRSLAANSLIKAGKDGLITIDVEDKDPKLATLLANGYVDELLQLTKVLAVTEASQRRLFFERQLEMAKNELAKAELALKNSLETGGVISVDSDSRALIETVGRLRAQISAREVQLGAMRSFVTTTNPEFQRAQQELNSLKQELARLQDGRGDSGGTSSAGATKRGLENIKILRDVKYYQMLYELLAKQFEAARLDEAKDSSVIQVLDRAVEPEHKSRPRIFIMMLIWTAIAGVLGILLAIGLDLLDRFRATPAGARQLAELRNSLRLRPGKSAV